MRMIGMASRLGQSTVANVPGCDVAIPSQKTHRSAFLAAGFYSGPVAAAIAEAVCSRRGVLTEGDLAAHRSAVVPPISTVYKGHRVYEVPPPTQVPVSAERQLV